MSSQCPICNKKKGNCHFPAHLTPTPPCLECQHTWKPAGIKYKGTDLGVIHGRAPIRLLGIWYNMWLDSTAQRRYVMEGITEMACFLQKNRNLSIENSLRLVECTVEFKQVTAAFVRCNKKKPDTCQQTLARPRHFSRFPETKEASR